MAENIMNNENTMVVKFRCPMEFVVAPEDVEKDCYEVSASHFADHADEINKLICESFGIDGAEECGLAAYLIDDDLAEKIISIIPSVENINGELCGTLTVTLREELTDIETGKLKKELIEQLDNGWGWDFNEDIVNVSGEDVYISFLCAKNGERLHVLNADEAINQTMGGIS